MERNSELFISQKLQKFLRIALYKVQSHCTYLIIKRFRPRKQFLKKINILSASESFDLYFSKVEEKSKKLSLNQLL